MDIRLVCWRPKLTKELESVPAHIRDKFQAWVVSVKLVGLRKVRQIPGFHDEPLLGPRRGQRSVRLSRSWRIFYHELRSEKGGVVEVLEITHHEY